MENSNSGIPAFSSSGGSNDHGSGDSGHHVAAESLIIFFLFAGLGIGGIVKEINKKTGIPYTPMLFIIGIIFGFFHNGLGMFGQAAQSISKIDPHGMLMIFLPTLIFESGMNADWHVFKRQFVQVFILAVPCVLVGAFMLAFCIKVVLGYGDEYYTWPSAFMFGSVLSCTDTVAVLALLKEVGAAKKFSCLIEGESLINDGTCMVLLRISAELVKGNSMTVVEMGATFISLTVGGTILGIIFGAISAFWLKKLFNDDILVVNITFIMCYILYFVCENVDLGVPVSGIIALVALGLFMSAFGKTKITPETEHSVHTFWRYIVYVCETIIFLIAGIIVGIKVVLGERDPGALPITFEDYIKLFGLYICMTVVRFAAIGVFMGILKNHGYGLRWNEVIVLTYGGLRGAIGICFALIIAGDESYDPTLREFMLFDMAGCAFLTLIINATTCGYMVRAQGLASTSTSKQRAFLGFIQNFLMVTKDCKNEIRRKPFMESVDWKRVDKLIGMDGYENTVRDGLKNIALGSGASQKLAGLPSIHVDMRKVSSAKGHSKFSVAGAGGELSFLNNEAPNFEEKLDEQTKAEYITEFRTRFIMALKSEYHHLSEHQQCGANAFLILNESADWDLDAADKPMMSWDYLSHQLLNPAYLNFLLVFKGLPLIGKWFRMTFYESIAEVYDIVKNYIEAMEEVEHLARGFPFGRDISSVVLHECEKSKEEAVDFLCNYLNKYYPEVNSAINQKNSAFKILNNQKESLNQSLEQGQIEEKEFKVLKKVADKLSYNLGNNPKTWLQFDNVEVKFVPFEKPVAPTSEEMHDYHRLDEEKGSRKSSRTALRKESQERKGSQDRYDKKNSDA